MCRAPASVQNTVLTGEPEPSRAMDTALAAAHLCPAFLREHILRFLALAVHEAIARRGRRDALRDRPALTAILHKIERKGSQPRARGMGACPPPCPPTPRQRITVRAHLARQACSTLRAPTQDAQHTWRGNVPQRPRGRQGWRVAQTRRDLHRPRRRRYHQSSYAQLPRISSPRGDSQSS